MIFCSFALKSNASEPIQSMLSPSATCRAFWSSIRSASAFNFWHNAMASASPGSMVEVSSLGFWESGVTLFLQNVLISLQPGFSDPETNSFHTAWGIYTGSKKCTGNQSLSISASVMIGLESATSEGLGKPFTCRFF